ncbi:MAG: hypothetical protein IPN13_14375 [Bacteroidetes bacterium]|nr:hypothetical protein [Bacteroidota bacterium]
MLFLICASAQLPAQITVDTIGTTMVNIETVVDTTHFAGGYDSGPWDLHWGLMTSFGIPTKNKSIDMIR